MEPEELQVQWNRINERLEKTEQLNIQLLKKVTTQRIGSIWNHFIKFEFTGIVTGAILLIVMFISHHTLTNRLHGSAGTILLYALISSAIVYEIIILIFLMRRNPAEENLTQAYKNVLLYQKWVKRESLFACIIVLVLIPLVSYWLHIKETWFYLSALFFILFCIGLIIYIYWYYMKNLQNIRKSLKELENFEKEY